MFTSSFSFMLECVLTFAENFLNVCNFILTYRFGAFGYYFTAFSLISTTMIVLLVGVWVWKVIF